MSDQLMTPAPAEPTPTSQPPPRGPTGGAVAGIVIGAVIAAVAVVALVAGLLIWAPWSPRAPSAPTGLNVTSTAASVTLTWSPGEGGAEVEGYVILRDGDDVGSVSKAVTTYTDEGLTPATEYRYQVVATSADEQSDPSATATASTLAPSPVGLRIGAVTTTSITIRWSPPPDAPQPDRYVIQRDGSDVGTVLGDTTSYRDTGLDRGSSYVYRVAAIWNGNTSETTPVLTGRTLLSSAPLQGSWTATVKNTKTPGGSIEVGDTARSTWTFTPKCSGSDCPVVVKGRFLGDAFSTTLTRDGSTYTGKTKVSVMRCGSLPIGGPSITSTLTIHLSKGKVGGDGLWTSWNGHVTMNSPYTEGIGLEYCPAQTHVFSVTGR